MKTRGARYGCEGKKRYKTYYEGARAIKIMRRRLEEHIFSLYKCKACKQWHIGNTLKGGSKYE